MNPEEFLKQNRYNLTPAEADQAMTDLQNMDNYSWAKKYNELFSQKTKGWAEISDKFSPLPERLVKSFGTSDRENPFERPKAYLDDVYKNNYSDVPRAQFDQMMKNMSQNWQDEKRAREYEAARTRREKEVKSWGKSDILTTPWLRDLLASDYEKRRYIEHPEEAIFGEETPKLGEAENTRWSSMGDIGLGAAAVGADIGTSFLKATPYTYPISVLAGPSIRGLRDVAYKVSDSPYQKEWGEIGSDIKSDVLGNAAIEGLANWRGVGRVLRNIGTKNIDVALENKQFIKDTKKYLDAFPTKSELPNIDDVTLWRMVDDLPEGQLKTNLKKYAGNVQNIDRAGIADELDRASQIIDIYENPAAKETVLSNIKENVETFPKIGEREYESRILAEKALSGKEKLGKAGVSVAKKIPEKIGGALKAATEAPGKAPVAENLEERKDWYKKNFTRDWLLGFKPKEKEGDPKWEAYKDWYFDKYGVLPEGE